MDRVIKYHYINPNVKIQAFDCSSKSEKYLIILGKCHWIVSKNVHLILGLMNEKISEQELFALAKKKYGIGDKKAIEMISLLARNKVIDSEAYYEKSKAENKWIWFKITLFYPEFIKKFKVLSRLFKNNMFIILGIIALVSQIYILFQFIFNDGLQLVAQSNLVTLLIFAGFTVIISFVHELGHSCSNMANGNEPGNIGFGIYGILPVFYSDVTETWRNSRKQRVFVDLGGVYFESLFILFIYIIGITLPNKYLYLYASTQTICLWGNFNPFIKLDGYWVFSDAIGIPNLHKICFLYVKKLFHIPVLKNEEHILGEFIYKCKKKEHFLFYVYFILMFAFVGYGLYFMVALTLTSIIQLKYLVEAISISKNMIQALKVGFKWLFGNTMSFIYLIVITKFMIKILRVIIIKGLKGVFTQKNNIEN